MKPSTQRKMLRAIASKKSQRRTEVARISQAQDKVYAAYDDWKMFKKMKAQPKMGGISGV